MVRRQTTARCDKVIRQLCVWLPSDDFVMLSGDGSLSVMDVRSNRPEPMAQSEDQEDELLSITPIKEYVIYCSIDTYS